MKKKISMLVLFSMIGVWFAMPSMASVYEARSYYKVSDRHAAPIRHKGRHNAPSHRSRNHSDYDQDYWGYDRHYYRNHSWRHNKRHYGHHRTQRAFSQHGRHHDGHDSGVKIRIYYEGFL